MKAKLASTVAMVTLLTAVWTTTEAVVDVVGTATVIDANTIEVQGTAMRLWGLDAPTDQWCTTRKKGCGERAKEVLEDLVRGERVWCMQIKVGTENAWVGEVPAAACAVIKRRGRLGHPAEPNKKQSVNIRYVAEGWAAAWHWLNVGRNNLGSTISKEGEKARKRKRGMWRYALAVPEDSTYRTRNPYWIPPASLTIHGHARKVATGDRMGVDGKEIRLAGISAAEDKWCMREKCSFKSAHALGSLLPKDRRVSCAPVSWDPRDGQGATMAMCTALDPEKNEYCDQKECWLNWQQVANGHAIARRELAVESRIVRLMARAEDDAIRNKHGMWKEGVDTAQIADETMKALPWLEAWEKITIRGPAEVLGTDRLRIDGHDLALWGAIGTELEWCMSRRNRDCDREARAALKELMEGKIVECSYTSGAKWYDTWKRVLCTTEEQAQCQGVRCTLNWKMLREGWGMWMVSDSGFNKSRLVHELIVAEELARDERKGMWRGVVALPNNFKEYRMAP